MNVALVIANLGTGGAQRVMVTMANYWAAQGWGVDLISLDRPRASYYPLNPEVKVHHLAVASRSDNLGETGVKTLRRVWTLRRTLHALRPDLVISFLATTNLLTLLAGLGSDLRVVVSERNNPAFWSENPLRRRIRILLYRFANRLVVQTRDALAHFPPPVRERAAVIPNPISISAPAKRDGRTIIAVGRLDRQKGFDCLLEAFRGIADRHPEWNLVVWGEGLERGALERQRAALGLDERVRFAGVSATPTGWTQGAEIFVLSSRYEGFPNVLGEAMMAGLPAIATDCPSGPRDIISDGSDGLLVPRDDPAALAGALERLIEDPALRDRLGEAARHSAQRFNVEAIMTAWTDMAGALTGQPAGALEALTPPVRQRNDVIFMSAGPPDPARYWFTVFTPVYNRGHFLPRIYESLRQQTCQDFEWLIVDDGSTDNSREIAQSLIEQGEMTIRYIWKPNGGLHTALNLGVAEAQGYFFRLVDDDDWLAPRALERSLYHWHEIPEDQREAYSGVVGLCSDPKGQVIGTSFPANIMDSNPVEIRTRHHVTGDNCGIQRTGILRAFPFPDTPGQHVPLSLIWNRIAAKYKMRYFNEILQIKDFQNDGGTARIHATRARSPEMSVLYHREFVGSSHLVPLGSRLRHYSNLTRYSLHARHPFREQARSAPSLAFWLLTLPAGVAIFLKDKWQLHNERRKAADHAAASLAAGGRR